MPLFVALVLYGTLLLPLLAAQQPPFGVQSRLVLVPVTVTDARGRSLDGLQPADFTLLDNGKPRPVSVDTIGTGVAPLALVVAIQAAGISAPVLDKVARIGSLIQPLLTGERGCAAVLTFAEELRWLQPCTSDPTLITRAFQFVQPGAPKAARLLDAASAAIAMLGTHPNARRVLLLISESRDRGSEAELAPVLRAAQAAGVTVYAANYSAFVTSFTQRQRRNEAASNKPKTTAEQAGTHTGAPPACNPSGCPDFQLPPVEQRADILGGFTELVRLGSVNTSAALTRATGGAVYSFARLKGLEEAIQKLSAEVHSQYLLSFVPGDAEPGFHALQVRVSRPKAAVRARPGYWIGQLTP
jgi:VWFA-related protein